MGKTAENMTYKTSLNHEDFVLLLDALKMAERKGVITWSATDMVLENTKIEY